MLDDKQISFNAEKEIQSLIPNTQSGEEIIIELFLTLSKDRQKAVLSELWSEFKPERYTYERNFNNLPY